MAGDWWRHFGTLSRWFGGDGGSAPRGSARPRPASLIDSADFSTLTLEEVLRREPGALAVRLHIITLRSFKQIVAEEWDRYARSVELICDGVFRRQLGPRQVYGRYDDDTFLISFAGLPEADGSQRAAVIANELMHRLIGDRFVGAQICVGVVDRDAVVTAEGDLDLGAIDDAVRQAEPVDPTIRADTQDGQTGVAADGWRPIPVRPGDPRPGQRLTPIPTSRAARAEPQWLPLRWPPDGPRRPAFIDALPQAARTAIPDDIALVFRPTYASRWSRVTHYLCLPMRSGSGGRRQLGGAVLAPGCPVGQRAALDFAALYGALGELQVAVESRRGAGVIVPLAFSSLQRPYYGVVADILQSVSDALRLRYLTLELVDVPVVAGTEHLIGAVHSLRPKCRDILVRVSARGSDLDRVRAVGARAVGAVMPSAPDLANDAMDRLLPALGGGASYWWNVREAAHVPRLCAGGAILINGPFAGADVDKVAGEADVAV